MSLFISLQQPFFFGLHCSQAAITFLAAPRTENRYLAAFLQYAHPAWYVLAGVAEHYPSPAANALHDTLLPVAVVALLAYFTLHIMDAHKPRSQTVWAPAVFFASAIYLGAVRGGQGLPQETFAGQSAVFQDEAWVPWHLLGHLGTQIAIAIPALVKDEGGVIKKKK